jgi:galactokinase/mevalonate kinase-like predicted kinase
MGPAQTFVETPFNLDKDSRSCFHYMLFKGNAECLATVLNYERECLKKYISDELSKAFATSRLKTLDVVKGQLAATTNHDRETTRRFIDFNGKATDLFEEYMRKIVQRYRDVLL